MSRNQTTNELQDCHECGAPAEVKDPVVRLEDKLRAIAKGEAKAPYGAVHIIGNNLLVEAIHEITELRLALEQKELENISNPGKKDSPKLSRTP